jgi:hypothetical protein
MDISMVMVSKVKVSCHNCGQGFEKPSNEYNRQVRKGRDYFFCSRTCCTSWNHKRGTFNYEENIKRLSKYAGYDPSDEYTPYRWFVLRCGRRDKLKKRSGNITVEYLKGLFEEQQGICPFTGWKMVLPNNTNGWKSECGPQRASLDRIDNSKGYLEGNVRFICVMANFARNDFTDEEVIEFCKNGHQERLLGKSNEQVVLCCNYVHQVAPWIANIRKATPEEDANGIDVVVETTDYGDVPIQVKTSRHTGGGCVHGRFRR